MYSVSFHSVKRKYKQAKRILSYTLRPDPRSLGTENTRPGPAGAGFGSGLRVYIWPFCESPPFSDHISRLQNEKDRMVAILYPFITKNRAGTDFWPVLQA